MRKSTPYSENWKLYAQIERNENWMKYIHINRRRGGKSLEIMTEDQSIGSKTDEHSNLDENENCTFRTMPTKQNEAPYEGQNLR